MQPDQHLPESGKIAFRYGLIFGIGLFIIAAILESIRVIAFQGSGLSLLFYGAYWIIGLVAFFLVGMFAARKTGRVSTGTIAGLWAGIFDGVLYGIVATILAFIYTLNRATEILTRSSTATHISIANGRQIEIGILVFGQVFYLLMAIGLGAGLGALGGLVGRAISKVRRPGQPYPGQPYPGQPYPGQPYPGQPYPGQPYPGQPYPGQPYQGQPYPGQPYSEQQVPGYAHSEQQSPPDQGRSSQPLQPQNSPMQVTEPARVPEGEQAQKTEHAPNIYNSYLASQDPLPESPNDLTKQVDQ